MYPNSSLSIIQRLLILQYLGKEFLSGTEDIYKIYAESFRGVDHLHRIQEEAQRIVSDDLAASLQ